MNAANPDFGRAGLGGNSALAQMPRSRKKRIGLFKDLLSLLRRMSP
jgi:hypothetical protein